jgi:hypothetical protein
LYRIFDSLFRTEATVVNNYEAFPPQSLPSDCLLTRGTISQLLFTLGSTIAFDNPRLIYQRDIQPLTPDTPPLEPEFYNAIKLPPNEQFDFRLVLVSGKHASHDRPLTFGAFIKGLTSNEDIVKQQHDDWERSLLFQLAPIYDIFRSNVGKKAWTCSKDAELWFGEQGAGFAMGLINGGRRLSVLHKGSKGVYQTTAWRGDWELNVEIERVEVWAG